MKNLALTRLLQLASPTLPVGAYTYSQGLEWAVEAGVVCDETSAGRWIGDLLIHGVGRFEAPLLASLLTAWSAGDLAAVGRLDAEYFASRETAELRAETAQMGFSLCRLLTDLRDPALEPARAALVSWPEVAFPTVWTALAVHWKIGMEEAVTGYLWAWAENQVMAALKTVPLGQAAGQRLLACLGARLPEIAREALLLHRSRWSNFAPAFAIACSRHETQYSRLFRS